MERLRTGLVHSTSKAAHASVWFAITSRTRWLALIEACAAVRMLLDFPHPIAYGCGVREAKLRVRNAHVRAANWFPVTYYVRIYGFFCFCFFSYRAHLHVRKSCICANGTPANSWTCASWLSMSRKFETIGSAPQRVAACMGRVTRAHMLAHAPCLVSIDTSCEAEQCGML